MRALRAPLVSASLGAAAVALLYVRDPHTSGSYGWCPFLALTGLPCPGCGGLRAVHDLCHGDVVAAVSSNALAVAAVLAAWLLWVVWFVRRASGRLREGPVLTTRGALWLIAVIIVFAVLRTTAWGAWLAP